MKIAVLQATAGVNQVERNLAALDHWAAQAAAGGADLLVTPELFACGYAPRLVCDIDGEGQRAALARIAARHGLALVGSTVEHDGQDRYIAATLFDVDGRRPAHYRKSHLFGEEEGAAFVAGEARSPVVDLGGMRVALGICYDVEFPEYVRSMAFEGAEVLLVPTAVPLRSAGCSFDAAVIPEAVVPVRALESQVFVAYANHAGPDFAGRSCIASPWGAAMARAATGEQLILAEVGRDALLRSRAANPYLEAVRPRLYGNGAE